MIIERATGENLRSPRMPIDAVRQAGMSGVVPENLALAFIDDMEPITHGGCG